MNSILNKFRNQHVYDKETLHEFYHITKINEIVIGKIICPLAIILIPTFFIVDHVTIGGHWFLLLIRIPAIVFSVIYTIIAFSFPGKMINFLTTLILLFKISFIAMMCLIVLFFLNTEYYDLYYAGIPVVIFLLYAGHRGKTNELFFICFLPVLFSFIYILFQPFNSIDNLIIFTSAFILVFVITVLYELQLRDRLKIFYNSKIIEKMNDELKLKNIELIEKNKIIQDKNKQIRRDLSLAWDIQKSFIPKPTFMTDQFEIATLYKPMSSIGGDLLDIFDFKDEQKIGIFISDVSGHGVPAALVTSMLKTLLSRAAEYINNPGGLLQYINNSVIDNISNNFITAFYGIYDIKSKSFKYARAGHSTPFIIRENKAKELSFTRGIFLGIKKNIDFEEKEITLQDDDILLFYTDGLSEAQNSRRELFEEAGLIQALTNINCYSMKGYLDSIYLSLIDFRGKEIFDDDICILGMKVL